MLSDEEIKTQIIRKLHRRGKWGSSHTAFEHLKRGFTPRNTGRHGSKRVNKIGRELIKQNLILSKPTGYGLEVSLNPRMRIAIMQYLE